MENNAKMEKNARGKAIVKVSGIGIAANVLLAAVKIILGSISGSVAIISDAVNNITDSSSSLITIVGTRLAAKKPDKKHPFGYGRIEYLTSLIIAVIVLVTGAEMVITSVKNIIHPEEVSYNYITVIILLVTVATKVLLGIYTERSGRKLDSGALVASGKDAKNDAIISAVTVVSALIFMFTGVSIDAYAGVFISAFIIKAGIEVLTETLSKILGERAGEELSEKIYKVVQAEPAVLGAHDLILHNYGPGMYIGSINVEVEHSKKIGDLYPVLHRLQIKLYAECKAYLVFGMYAVDRESPVSKRVWECLDEFKENEVHCLGFHGVVDDEKEKIIFCDIVLDFDCDREELRLKATEHIKSCLPDYSIVVNIDTEFA